jgi:DNA polymerase-4
VRAVLHLDLDAFFASVEQLDDPATRGQPLVVGGPVGRGVVAAASYEARRFGVRSAMPMREALRLFPRLLVRRPRMARYAELSGRFFEILRRYSPLVEGLSLDEAFVDVTAERRLFGVPEEIARRIKQEVRDELGLVVSVGIASSKFVAKIASDLGKPDGLLLVDGDPRRFLAPLPVGRLWGVGPRLEQQLHRIGLATIGALAERGVEALAATVGWEQARHLVALAEGIDERPVSSERTPKSLGHEDTFAADLRSRVVLGDELLAQADRVAQRLRRAGLRAQTVTLKLKYADFQRLTRQTTLASPTCDGAVLAEAARRLLTEVPDIEGRGVRLVGLSASQLVDSHAPRQLTFEEPKADRGERLGATLDRIAERFGAGRIGRAVHLAGRAGAGRLRAAVDEPGEEP